MVPGEVLVLSSGPGELEHLVKTARSRFSVVQKQGESALPSLIDAIVEAVQKGEKPEVKQQEELEVNNEPL